MVLSKKLELFAHIMFFAQGVGSSLQRDVWVIVFFKKLFVMNNYDAYLFCFETF